jgi:hypothetical protein
MGGHNMDIKEWAKRGYKIVDVTESYEEALKRLQEGTGHGEQKVHEHRLDCCSELTQRERLSCSGGAGCFSCCGDKETQDLTRRVLKLRPKTIQD